MFPAPCFRCIVPLVQVDICLLADQVGVTTSDTLDFGQGVHDLLLAVDIGIEETELWLLGGDSKRTMSILTMNWKFDFSPDTSDMIATVVDVDYQVSFFTIEGAFDECSRKVSCAGRRIYFFPMRLGTERAVPNRFLPKEAISLKRRPIQYLTNINIYNSI